MNLGIDIHLPAPLVFHQEVPQSPTCKSSSRRNGKPCTPAFVAWLGT